MIFKIYNCDLGLTINDVNYDFTHIDDLTIDDPEMNNIIRGGNASNKIGIAFKEGIRDPKVLTCTIRGLSMAMHSLIQTCYEEQTRVGFYCIDRGDGSSKVGKNAIIKQMPQQLSVNEGEESMNIIITLATFDLKETHKSDI